MNWKISDKPLKTVVWKTVRRKSLNKFVDDKVTTTEFFYPLDIRLFGNMGLFDLNKTG